jgi:hypothetical protein
MPVTVTMPPKMRSFLRDAMKPTDAMKQRMRDSIREALRETLNPTNDVDSARFTSPVRYRVGQTFDLVLNGKTSILTVTHARKLKSGRWSVKASK